MVAEFQTNLTRKAGRPRMGSMEVTPSIIGKRIEERRLALNWSLHHLSDETETAGGNRVSPQAINAIERGHSQNPTLKLLKPIAKALGVSLAELADEEPALVSAG